VLYKVVVFEMIRENRDLKKLQLKKRIKKQLKLFNELSNKTIIHKLKLKK